AILLALTSVYWRLLAFIGAGSRARLYFRPNAGAAPRGPSLAEHALRWRVGEPVRRRDRLAGDLAVVHVQAGAQVRVLLQSLHPALVGERQRERQGRVVERKGRGAGDRARHVGDAIVHDAVDHIGRMRMGRRLRSLAAAALVDGDVDDD